MIYQSTLESHYRLIILCQSLLMLIVHGSEVHDSDIKYIPT